MSITSNRLEHHLKNLPPAGYADTGCQQERVVEEGKFGRVRGIFALLTCVVSEMSAADIPDAVPAAGPLCTHGKDTTGLAP